MRSLVAVFVLTLGGCGADGTPYPVQPGTYEVMRWIAQNTGEDRSPAPGTATLTVALTSDGLTLDSNDVFPLPSFAIPGSETTYHVAEYSARVSNCEAGPNKMCIYGFTEVTVTGRASDQIHIETCMPSDIFGGCSAANPTCTVDQAATVMGVDPCEIFGVVDGELRGP